MSENLARAEYQLLSDMGDLLALYPELTGDWEEDKDKFMLWWESNQDALNSSFAEDQDNE
jgi:hypothetical protein